MLIKDHLQTLVCEWHDDYLVVYEDGAQELVSVKHREASVGPWNVRDLCEAGGVRQLFQRWRRTGGCCRCCVETNAGLRSGQAEAAGLAHDCSTGSGEALGRWAIRIADHLAPYDDLAQIESFLAALSIDARLPGRMHIRAAHIETYMRPAMQSLGMPGHRAADAYDRIVECIADASRDEDDNFDAIDALANPDRLTTDVLLRDTLKRRSIDRRRLLYAITGLALGIEHLLLPSSTTTEPTVLVKKLQHGGLGPTGLNSARRLRSSWLAIRHAWSSDLPGSNPELDHLRTKLLHLVQQAETSAMEIGGLYGRRMQRDLESRLSSASLGHACALPVSDEALLGFVYDLTELCEIWWSREFNLVDA
jgi:hypothetical protein